MGRQCVIVNKFTLSVAGLYTTCTATRANEFIGRARVDAVECIVGTSVGSIGRQFGWMAWCSHLTDARYHIAMQGMKNIYSSPKAIQKSRVVKTVSSF